jgi:integrase
MLKTRSGLPKYCSWNVDRHGVRRVRFRKGGSSIYLTGIPWSADFMRAYAAALEAAGVAATNIGSDRTIKGSFNELLARYYRSADFAGMKPSSQSKRRRVLERFRNEHGHKPFARLERIHIQNIIDAKAATPQGANELGKALRVVLGYAEWLDLIPKNPAVGVKLFPRKGDGIAAWSEDEIEQFERCHAIGTKARLVTLLLYTCQRGSDVIRMGWQDIQGGSISVRQQKTGAALLIPMHPALVAVLASTPRSNLTFLMTELGSPFKAGGFRNWFRHRCNEAGLPHRSAHGLRKLGATRLLNAGCTDAQVMAVTGHKTNSMLRHYTKTRDQHHLAQQAIDIQTEQEQKLANHRTSMSNRGKM